MVFSFYDIDRRKFKTTKTIIAMIKLDPGFFVTQITGIVKRIAKTSGRINNCASTKNANGTTRTTNKELGTLSRPFFR